MALAFGAGRGGPGCRQGKGEAGNDTVRVREGRERQAVGMEGSRKRGRAKNYVAMGVLPSPRAGQYGKQTASGRVPGRAPPRRRAAGLKLAWLCGGRAVGCRSMKNKAWTAQLGNGGRRDAGVLLTCAI